MLIDQKLLLFPITRAWNHKVMMFCYRLLFSWNINDTCQMFYFSLISHRYNFRSSHRRFSLKKGVLKNFANFTGKHLYRSLILIRISVWVRIRVSFRVGSQFSSRTIVLGSSKELRFVFVKIWWKYEIDHFPIRIFRRCHSSKKISTQQYALVYRSSHP